MNTTTRTNRTNKVRKALLLVVVATGVVLSSTACNAGRLTNYVPRTAPAVRLETLPAERDQVTGLVNVSRVQAGLRPVRQNATLDAKADAWAKGMRDRCQISHSRLADGAPSNWRKLGENVGTGNHVAEVHNAYMASPGHRANVLDPTFTEIGTASVWGNCGGFRRVFTVHVFMAS
jgi:uncharacterized protein YkwD